MEQSSGLIWLLLKCNKEALEAVERYSVSEKRCGMGSVWVSNYCVEVFQRRGGGEDGMECIGWDSLRFVEV